MAFDLLFDLGGWRRKINRGGKAIANTQVGNRVNGVIGRRIYDEHLRDLYKDRLNTNSQQLLEQAFETDPDVSAAVSAYLTLANTEPTFQVTDINGCFDEEGFKILNKIVTYMFDYDRYDGFSTYTSLRRYCSEQRYMMLLRGGICGELIFDRMYAPETIRLVDLGGINWKEKSPGIYKPFQYDRYSSAQVNLDIPTLFISFFRGNPTSIYKTSHFVSAINIICARTNLINDLYRIMTVTGYPRIDITILEEIVNNSMPPDIRADAAKRTQYLNDLISSVKGMFYNLRPDQAFIHYDSIQTQVINDKNSGMAIDVSKIIDVLNAQNQAALKAMGTILGRGEKGVNTASTEARIFSMNADELNAPLAEHLSRIFTFLLRVQGRLSFVKVHFAPAELRPDLELEPQRVLRQKRLLELLSLGIITDQEFYVMLFGKYNPDCTTKLSGTMFMNQGSLGVDTSQVSSNSDPLGRSLSPDGSSAAHQDTSNNP